MHEETPVDSIIAPHSLEVVFHEIHLLLESQDPDAIAHVLGFIRDASLYAHPFHDSFRAYLDSSNIWAKFEQLLGCPHFHTRGNVIHAIGKLTCRNQSRLLSEAFPFFLENDPINLPHLIMELLWLTKDWHWNFLERTASADHYLQRWSLCQILDDNGCSETTLRRFADLLNVLKSDPHVRVAAEANLRFERVNVKLGPKLAKTEWRKEVKRIASLTPKVTFERAAMAFTRDRQDYTLE